LLHRYFMKIARIVLFVLSVLVVLVGLIWAGQGAGYIRYPENSFMIDQSPWILRGGLVALCGVIGVWLSRRV